MKNQQQTTEYNDTEYTVPRQETWYVIKRNNDRNRVRFGAEAYSQNRVRVKKTKQGAEIRLDDVPLGRIDTTGCVEVRIDRVQASSNDDLKDVANRNTFGLERFEEGAEIYKTAEDENTLYFSTTKPSDFEHEMPTPVEDAEDDDTTDWTDADATATVSEPTATRIGPDETVDDLKVGERYYAEVNNTDGTIGAWVSLPDTEQNHLSGLAHRKHHDTDLSKLKTRDAVHVVLRSIDTKGRPGFVIIDGADTMNDVDFVDTAPEEVVYLDEDNNPMRTPDVDPKIWTTTETPDEAEAEFKSIPDSPDIKTMSTDEFVDHLEHTSVPDTFIEALEDQPDNFAADASEVRRRHEIRQKEGSLAHTFAATDGGTESYADLGQMADDAGISIEEAAEPELTKHYADSDSLKNNAQAIFQVLRQTGVDVDPADYIRQKFAELDDEQQREFISWAANSEIPDELFRKLTRELL